MNNPNIITLVQKSIQLTVVPIRKTIKWTDKEGFKYTKRNQLRVSVSFTGFYENDFNVGDMLFDWEHKQNFIAISKNAITTLESEFKQFTLPNKLVLSGSCCAEGRY